MPTTPDPPAATIAPPPSTPATGAIVSSNGLCLDDNGRVTPNGNAIQLYQCNGTPAQVWTFQTDSTIQVLGKCLQVTAVAVGGRTELWDCDGSKGEAWRVGPSRSLVNLISGLCLDNAESSHDWGTRLEITTCDGQASQSWSIPAFTS